MKVLLIAIIAIHISTSGFSMKPSSYNDGIYTFIKTSSNCTGIIIPVQPPGSGDCLETALGGINQAYANYDNNIRLCASIHTTGQGFLDCARHARRIRELQVAMVYYFFENCDDSPPTNGA